LGNPFLIPEANKKKEAPDVMGVLGKLHWQTELEAQMHILSMRLGQMEGIEYKFLLPGAPSDWPDWYLDAVLSHDTSVKLLRARQEIEAKDLNRKAQAKATHEKIAQMVDPTGSQQIKDIERNRKAQEFFAKMAKDDGKD
jgi:hypothetical protein